MAMKQVELILNNILLGLQACLGIWQLMMLTLVGALLRGLVGWLLPGLPQSPTYSPTYSRLQHCKGRIFKKANCFVLQAHTPSQRKVIEAADKFDTIRVWYLGKRFLLEKSGSQQNMLSMNGKMCYYIIPRIWEELLHLGEEALLLDVPGPAGAPIVDACVDDASTVAAARVAIAPHYSTTVFVKGYKQCWKDVMRSGVMTFEEVVEGIILYDQRVSNPFKDHWLLPISLSVSKEDFPKFLNFTGFLLHGKVHWVIPTTLSLISALLEFSTRLRVWVHTKLNVLFCYIMHLKPSNEVELKMERSITRAIIAGGAQVDKDGATLTLVPWLDVADQESRCSSPFIENQFCCNFNDIKCTYIVRVNSCYINVAINNTFSVACKSIDEFRHIITLVSWMANNGCGSLKSCGPNNKVFVRGFKESVLTYVKNGCPSVYELELNNVVVH